ncbi:hypothetical protein PTI98_009272 [Pleurotus ostreatus]|nr:hypothetical protein PTI98_009272 [Pleurotus ostreatus]
MSQENKGERTVEIKPDVDAVNAVELRALAERSEKGDLDGTHEGLETKHDT